MILHKLLRNVVSQRKSNQKSNLESMQGTVCYTHISILTYSIPFEWVYLADYDNDIEITEFSGIRKNRTDRAPYQPPGGHQANYSALRRCVDVHTPLSWAAGLPLAGGGRIPAGLSGRNPKI